MNVLIVCDYNATRGPATEIITREKAKQAGLEIKVSSAGLNKLRTPRIKSEMRIALEQLKYPTDHIPRQITPEITAPQDLILCFTKKQRATLRTNTDKPVFTLPEYVSWFYKEIRDPEDSIKTPSISFNPIRKAYLRLTGQVDSTIYEDVVEKYYQTARTIEKYADKLIIKLLKSAEKNKLTEIYGPAPI